MLLSVADLASGYGRQDIINGVSFDLSEKDFSCLLGSNNSGKSTMINTLSGLIRARAGTIEFCGEDISRLRPNERVRRGLVQIPEGRQLFPEMTVFENIIMGGNGDRRSPGYDRSLLDDVFDLFPNLRDRSQQRAGSLSGGEQQMVAIGRGMMSRPTLLMLDEPSLGLAPMAVESIFETLSQLNDSGVSILLVEQNLHVSLQHARYAYVLERGEIVVRGTAEEIAGDDNARKAYLGM
ncbi:ABC transporter ATP-binding protein [Brevibacterium atlanticum]|uniref:ABC transporter ATP-binding protein n=1 Tax=Brevibacterium atlanticum TaxID=2697563 RepID=UPI0014245993|nr:ABC transporter ATP-binding protein [Brevibacterium atlanticum]